MYRALREVIVTVLMGFRRPIMNMITGRAPPPHRAESCVLVHEKR